MPSQIRVAVAPAAEYEKHRPLFDMLSAAMAVTFEPHSPRLYELLSGLIVLSEDAELVREAIDHGLNCYQVHNTNPLAVTKQNTLKFTSSAINHRAFRNAELCDPSLEKFSVVPEASETLVVTDNRPVWTVERRGNCECHHVGIDLPPFAGDDFFHARFRAARWFAMLPLLHFLRHLLGPAGWPQPKSRATFIIDDPNLHFRSYGYIDFEKLARHAEVHNYHATVATVPLDAWYFNSQVAALFRAQKRRISMMMHGVNHIADELARGYTEEQRIKLLAEGLRRIVAFESRAGLKVDRVMAAPHGAFAESIADPMLRLGYEAGCVSVGSLVRWNPEKRWPADLGLPIAQAFGSLGFPVFHRVGTSGTDVRLSTFLGHPIVIATHHQDYISNFSLIERLANVVNAISLPQWMTIEDISRTNYVATTDGNLLRIKPYARRLRIALPKEVSAVQLLASPFCGEGSTVDVARVTASSGRASVNHGEVQYSIADNMMEVSFPPSAPLDYREAKRPRLGLWPVARRLLAEGRDRAKPMLTFASSR